VSSRLTKTKIIKRQKLETAKMDQNLKYKVLVSPTHSEIDNVWYNSKKTFGGSEPKKEIVYLRSPL